MAASLGNRVLSPTNQTPTSFLKLYFNALRSFSSAAQNPAAASSPSAAEKPKRRKKKNLFEVAQFLPNWGIGYHMAKSHWTNVYYEITKINLNKDGRHGKAWGIAYKDGEQVSDEPKKISGVHKRCWRYIPSLAKLKERTPNPPKSREPAAKVEVEAA